jgi:PAS domain S-box-containing protein
MDYKKDDYLREEATRLLSQKEINYDQWGNDVKKIIEELSIYQIELQHQNEALETSQAELQLNIMKYQDLFDNAPISYLVVDKDETIIQANTTFNNIFGVSTETLCNTRFYKYVSPAFQDIAYHYFRLVRNKSIRTSIDIQMLFDRHIFYVRLYASTQENYALRLALIDISVQKRLEIKLANESMRAVESEEKFRKLVEQSQNTVFSLNTKTLRFEYVSPMAQNMFGYSSDEVLQMDRDSFNALILPEYRSVHDQVFESLLSGKEDEKVFYANFKMRTRSGAIKDIEASYSLVKVPDNSQSQIVGYLRDVTSIKLYEKEVAEMNKAKETERIKMTFLANMSHEIRTPLNAIIGFSEMMMTEEDPLERKKFMDIITTNSNSLLNLIGDILDMSKIESDTINILYEQFDIVPLFNDLYYSFLKNGKKKDVEIVTENKISSLLITSDRNRISQILTNFLTNAIKYTPKGKIIMGMDLENEGLKLYVKDTGIGIPDNKKPMIFQRFMKLDNFAQGSGLGLSICKALTERLGGKIGFESTEGEGSLFWAWIPCKPCDLYVDKLSESKLEVHDGHSANAPAKDKENINILVAEDSESNFMLLKMMLHDYKVVRAITGKEAVELCKVNHFDIVFMDLTMPVMNGLDATHFIREFNSKIPIVAVTANAFLSDRDAAFAAGCSGFISKPFTRDQILEELRKISIVR